MTNLVYHFDPHSRNALITAERSLIEIDIPCLIFIKKVLRAYLLLPLVISQCVQCAYPNFSHDQSNRLQEQFRQARRLWQQRDVRAYEAWMAIDPNSAQGKEARRLLARAQVHYLKGIRLFRAKNSHLARQAFIRGAAIAPIDPARYLPLARVYRQRGLQESAAKYYQKYLSALPDALFAGDAQRELAELDLGIAEVFDPPEGRISKSFYDRGEVGLNQIMAIVSAGSLILSFSLLLIWWHSGRGVSLDRLIQTNPELHSAIAYLLGSLRHELLKHRIGAVSDLLATMNLQQLSQHQQAFLCQRLYGGVPLQKAWEAHILAFIRVLGNRLNPYRDKDFRRARRAIRTISTLRAPFSGFGAKTLRKLQKAHGQLKRFDQSLALKQSQLLRTRIDDALLQQVLDEVRGEYATSSISLNELSFQTVNESIEIEVPRVDLILVLKNIVRNAILAVGRGCKDGRVRIEVRVDLEPTGLEAVRICICDSSSERLNTDMLSRQDIGSGLGLVSMAVKRYGGSIEVEPAQNGYSKAVVMRFFRAFEDNLLDRKQ